MSCKDKNIARLLEEKHNKVSFGEIKDGGNDWGWSGLFTERHWGREKKVLGSDWGEKRVVSVDWEDKKKESQVHNGEQRSEWGGVIGDFLKLQQEIQSTLVWCG